MVNNIVVYLHIYRIHLYDVDYHVCYMIYLFYSLFA